MVLQVVTSDGQWRDSIQAGQDYLELRSLNSLMGQKENSSILWDALKQCKNYAKGTERRKEDYLVCVHR